MDGDSRIDLFGLGIISIDANTSNNACDRRDDGV